MMRVNGGPMTMKRWMLASAVGAFLLACGDSGGKSDTTKSAGPPGRNDLVNEAESNYSFGGERQLPATIDQCAAELTRRRPRLRVATRRM